MALRRKGVRLYSEAGLEWRDQYRNKGKYWKYKGRRDFHDTRPKTFYLVLPRKETSTQYAKGLC